MIAKLPAVIFTWAGDASAVPWCVIGAEQAGLLPVVAEDAAAPLPAHTIGWLRRRGVPVWTTGFPRRGNLNGTDCAAGICRTLSRAAWELGEGHAMKLDTDTVVVRSGIFASVSDAAMIALTCREDRLGGYGMAYRLSADAADDAAERLERRGVDVTAPEDVTILRTVDLDWVVWAHEFIPGMGPFSAFPADGDPVDFAARFDVLTVGNAPDGGWADRPRQVAAAMRSLVCRDGLAGISR